VINNYVYGKQARNDLHYTLAIQPELGNEDNETYMMLNLGVLANNGSMLYLDSEDACVEIGYYDGTDKATVFKAFNKIMKAAHGCGLYVTELDS